MPHRLHVTCGRAWLIDDAGIWHDLSCKYLEGEGFQRYSRCRPDEVLAVPAPPWTCHRCRPQVRAVTGAGVL